ncbi:esterase family protein [Ornithinicoccus hortensis]|uniref:Esterase/lipase superfamily enzyme n=1 Tax=Ornithinicoccus hortensis TaxID=82346 RepID=A0A542YPH0_9MICO|nr:alpha/beta hydrolase-fold protein [Ornithinicoccus hortensis]TQL50003.1 esterase/lipase superfamily enzyme [Ornithinicoccus hortensis]
MKAVERWVSPRMQQEISLARWGHGGIPVLVLPTAGGDAEEIERHHLVTHLGDLIESGAIRLFSCDSVAGKAMTLGTGTVQYRNALLNQFHQAVAHEVVPAIRADAGTSHSVIVAGASIGAFNSVALICRFPELFGAAIGMSGTYDVERFLGGYTDDLYFSSPTKFLPGLEGPQLEVLRKRFVLLASGTGAWENIDESWRMAGVLGKKGVPNRVDDWGPEFEHEWPTWWAMLPKYLKELLG